MMYCRLSAFRSAAIIISLVILGTLTPLVTLAAEPHEDPDEAELVSSDIAMLRYLASLDFKDLLNTSPDEMLATLNKLPFANIPQGLGKVVGDFSLSGIAISNLSVGIDEQLSSLRLLVSESRFDEASRLADDIASQLLEADSELEKIDQAMATIGTELKISESPKGQGLRVYYDQALDKIDTIEREFRLDRELLTNLKLGINSNDSMMTTELTFRIPSTTVFVGESLRFEGVLTSSGKPLADREIDLLANGSRHLTVKTDANGFYQGDMLIPYSFLPELDLQALYYHREKDVGFYLSSLSPQIKVEVLSKAIPNLDTDIPRMALIPGDVQFGGKIFSEDGPLNGASVKLRFGQSQVELVSSQDGSFNTNIKVGMGLGLIGWQDFAITVLPKEPGLAPLQASSRILMVNVVNSVGSLAILMLAVYMSGRLRRAGMPKTAGKPALTAVPEAVLYHQQLTPISDTGQTEQTSQEPQNKIIFWYRLVVRLVEKITTRLLRAQQTLREFASESSRILGSAAVPFIELTRIVEKSYYSRHGAIEKDIERSEQLFHDLEKGLKE